MRRRDGPGRGPGARRSRRIAVGLLLVLAVASAGPSSALDRWTALRGLARAAVAVTVSPNHPELSAEELRARVEDALRRAELAPVLDAASAERLRLIVGVRPYSSADLRGFYLPLSQSYGIGPVRLVVERPAAVAGIPDPIAAQVWQAERQAKAPWRRSAAEIVELVDQVVASFLADYRRAIAEAR